MSLEMTELERAVLAWLDQHATSEALKAQLQNAEVSDRRFSAAGSFTTLEVPSMVPALAAADIPFGPTGPIDGPEILGRDGKWRASALLWIRDGCISILELAGPAIANGPLRGFVLKDR